MKGLKKKQIDFLEEYSSSWGNITMACKNLGIARKTFYNWLKEETFKAAIEELDIVERKKDRIEDALMKKIEAGDATAIIFACKTIAKDRGYIESRHHVSGSIIPSENFDRSVAEVRAAVLRRFKRN